MKKLFTLLFVAVTALAARATDYNVPITVTVNGVSSEQKTVITIEEADGRYNLTLKNFVLESENGPMGVGNVELKDITPCQDGDATLLITSRVVTITDGDDPQVPFWMAQSLPPVPVDLRGKIVGEHLRCFLDIDMTETLQQVIQVAIGEGYQMPNPSFEFWHTSTGNYMEPNAWHSFETATGQWASLAGHHIEKSEDAHSGEASARIFATDAFIAIANGTMTTGRMNAGSMSAADAGGNYAYLDMSSKDVDGNGDPFYTPMYARPDSVAVWVKFKQGKANAKHPYATVSAVITDGTRYQDPENNEDFTNVVARAKNNKIATTDGKWVRVSAPFVYTENNVEPKAVLITISTNADAGQGSANDEVLVDDIEFIYNAKVTGIKVKGQDVPDFDAAVLSYEMELNEELTPDDIEVEVEGKTAHIVKSVELVEGYYVCNVLVVNADMSVAKVYNIKSKSIATAVTDLQPTTNLPATYYTSDGRQVKTLVPGRIYISRHAGSVEKTLVR